MISINYLFLLTVVFCANFGFANLPSINHPNITLREDIALSASMLAEKQESSRKKVPRTFPSIPLVHSPRISAFYEDIHDQAKHCGDYASNHDWRPTFRGVPARCMFNAPMDRRNSFFLDHGQRTRIKNYILSNLVSTLKSDILLYSTKGTSKPINLESHTICKLFKIPESHKTKGLDNVDIIFYVAAGPQEYNEYTPAWADVCPTSKDQPIVVALNINAQMITQNNIVEKVIEIVKKSLNVSSCNGKDGKYFLTRNNNGGIKDQSKCITVNCAEKNQANKKVKHLNNNDWKECTNGANCPSFDDICKNWIEKEVTQTLTFSNSLTHSESITSSITETVTKTNTSSITNSFTQTQTNTPTLTSTFTQTPEPTRTHTVSSSLSVTSSLTKFIQEDSEFNKEKHELMEKDTKMKEETKGEIHTPQTKEEKSNENTEIKTNVFATTDTSNSGDNYEYPINNTVNNKEDKEVKWIEEMNELSNGEKTEVSHKSEENGSSENILEKSLQDQIYENNLTKHEENILTKRKDNQLMFDRCSFSSSIYCVLLFTLFFGIFTLH